MFGSHLAVPTGGGGTARTVDMAGRLSLRPATDGMFQVALTPCQSRHRVIAAAEGEFVAFLRLLQVANDGAVTFWGAGDPLTVVVQHVDGVVTVTWPEVNPADVDAAPEFLVLAFDPACLARFEGVFGGLGV